MKYLLPMMVLALAFGAISSVRADDANEGKKVAVEKINISYCNT